MLIPAIGQVVKLQQIVTDQQRASSVYKTRIADIRDGHYLAIELPTDEESGKVGVFLPDTDLYVWYMHEDGNHYQFRSKVIGKIDDNVPLILIQIPKKEEISKSQRRNFFRVAGYLPIAVKLMEGNRNFHFISQTMDVGGGGFSFTCDPSYVLKTGDLLKVWTAIPLKGNGIARAAFEVEVVRLHKPEDSDRHYIVSVKFTNIKEADHQKIIRYCYERQLELHRKKKI